MTASKCDVLVLLLSTGKGNIFTILTSDYVEYINIYKVKCDA